MKTINEILPTELISDLLQVEKELSSQIKTSSKLIQYINKHILGLKGKRLRPLLVLIVASAYNLPRDAVIYLACAIEMLHTATLVHDDVIDEAKIRRFKPTVNALWDNEISILAGDYLFSQASYILAKELPPEVTQLISLSVKDTCEGEIEQLCHKGEQNLSELEYLGILEKKTGSLFSVSCVAPAVMANACEKEIQSLSSYGRNIGIAFQLIDDYLDFISTETELGKPTNNDFDNGKLTLPLIYTLRESKLNKEDLQNIFSKTKPEIIRLVNRHKALDYCLTKAKEYICHAKNDLEFLNNFTAKQTLGLIADYAIQRNC